MKKCLKAKIEELETDSKIKKISEICKSASLTLRMVTILELIQCGMRSVIWVQTATVFWLDGRTVSLGC
jgi:hypothetical protein